MTGDPQPEAPRTDDRDDDDPGHIPSPATVLTRIPGERLDPDPKTKPDSVDRLEEKAEWIGVAWGAFERFKVSRSPLLAAGTGYYGFIAMFSLLAFAYGVAALLDAGAIADWLTETLESALPGLVGDEGIDPETLKRVGRTSSVVGLLLLAVSGAAVMGAANDSIHQIYGAPPDGRNPVLRRLHLLLWLAIIGPLVALSYSMSTAVSGFGTDILEEIGLRSPVTRGLVIVVATLVTFALDVGIVTLLLTRMGGIKPRWTVLWPGAVTAAIVIGAFKALTAVVVSWSVDRPQYGSFAIPVTVLVVLWAQSMALYAGASVTAANATRTTAG